MKHLAIFKGEGAELIFSGKKTIECRLSQRKDPPFGRVSTGDLVYIKPSGKDIIGQFRVKKVISYDGMTDDDLEEIKKRFAGRIAQARNWWEKKKGSKYGSLIFIGEVDPFITAPIKIPKKDLRGWVALG